MEEHKNERTGADAPVAKAVKTCSRCGQAKPLDDFYRDKRSPDGRISACKDCRKEINRRARAFKTSTPIMTIDFTGYEWLIEALEKEASQQVRTPEQQVIYYIKFGMKFTGGRPEQPDGRKEQERSRQ